MTRERYSGTPRPEVVAAAATYDGMTRAQLHAARQDAVARRDWLAMQAITYVMSLRFEGDLS